MSKGRFDSLDVQAMVANLHHTLSGRRISNIYDGLTTDSFIFKLDGTGDKFLLLESGVRFHTISNFSAESTMPSPTASKLRKHLRNLRIEKVSQIGQDRVVLFQCGVGASRHTLILELYAKGNLILTDADYTVLALLRSHVFDADAAAGLSVAVQVGQVYPVSYATNLATAEQDPEAVADATGGGGMTPTEWNEWAVQCLEALDADIAAATGKKSKKKKNKQMTLKMLLSRHDSKFAHLGPSLIEHCILHAQLKPNSNLKDQLLTVDGDAAQVLTVDEWSRLLESLQTEAPRVLDKMEKEHMGYILYKQQQESLQSLDNADPAAHADKLFEEFLPILLIQHEHRLSLEFEDFSRAVAEYFDRFQVQKNLQKALNAEKAAADKINKARQDQQERLDALYEQQHLLEQEASTVQMHADNVDKALAVINSALDSGMDWQQLEQVVDVEQENQNPIALLIHQLVLEDEAMILRLPTSLNIEPESEEETIDVKILLKETAHGNANRLFTQYRNAKEKASKTIDASAKAVKAAEESAKRQLAEAQKRSKQQVVSTTTKHKPVWFEKFRWFITTDNYLVIGGRDAHQNEQLVKRYLRPGDAYLHADVFGAASCILRAKRQRRSGGGTDVVPLSEQALREAGHFTICQSSAWTSRMVTSAWWVESHQVSKTPPAGEFLTVGAFMIRGKKNYLPPSQLEMGLGVMFRLGDEISIHRHLNDRRDFALISQEDDSGEIPVQIGPRKTVKPEATDQRIKREDTSKEPTDSDGQDSLNEVQTSTDLDSGSNTPGEIDDPDKTGPGDDPVEADSESNDVRRKPEKEKERRGLSVRDRKLIKKHGSLEAARLAQEKQSNIPNSTKKAKKPDEAIPNEKKRGKKTKQKRAQSKYADQDEEDKELAMQALQGGEKAKKKSLKGKGGKEEKSEMNAKQNEVAAETAALLSKNPMDVAGRLPEEVRKELALCVTTKDGNGVVLGVKWDKLDAETLEQLVDLEDYDAQLAAAKRLKELKETKQVDNFSASLGGVIRTIRKYGHDSMVVKQHAKESHEANQERTKSESDEFLENDPDQFDGEIDVVDDTAELNRLTGKPVVSDMLLSAVPVCAPYHTLSQYTFRVKLTPGSMKRGKASKQCLEIFTKGKVGSGDETQRLVNLIKRVTDGDWVNAMSGDVKISAPGAGKIEKKYKAQKKKAQKK